MVPAGQPLFHKRHQDKGIQWWSNEAHKHKIRQSLDSKVVSTLQTNNVHCAQSTLEKNNASQKAHNTD